MPASQSYTSDGSKTATSDPFSLNGNRYNTKVETTITNGNVKNSAITLQKEVTTKSGKDYQGYATSYDGGKTWYEPGVKPLKKISTSSGLTADEIKSLQPGGALNKEITKSSQLAAKKNDATANQLNQLKNGNDATTDPNKGGGDPNNEALIKDLEASKNTRVSFPKDLRYPRTLKSEYQDVIVFNMLKYEPRKLDKGGEANLGTFGTRSDYTKRIIGNVILPIPSGISDSNSVNWQSDELTSAQKALADLANAGITGGLGAAADTASRQAGQVQESSQEIATGLGAYFTQQATNVKNILSRTQGAVQNPNMELLFMGPQLRSFNFNFKLSARSKEEAQDIRSIIRFFKQGMAPQRTESQLFLKAPHTFQLVYKHIKEEHKFLNKFKECALLSFSVDYTPEGQYATFTDGAMVSYGISMQFQELEPIFNEDYGNTQNALDTEIGF